MSEPAFLQRRPGRAVIAVTGADARTFLQRVITNGPETVSPGSPLFSALLTPQGKVLADFLLFDDEAGGLFIDAPESESDALIKRFSLYRMRADASISRRDDLCVATALSRPGADALAAGADPRAQSLGWRAIAPAEAAGAPDPDYELRRIEAAAPEFGADYGPSEVFSTDVNHDLISGIDYRKGCFVGQEVASRMHRKGGVRKRTVRLDFETVAAAAGAEVRAGEVQLGTITSAHGRSALARVRVDRLGDAPTVDAGGAAARVHLPEPAA